jgi:hypothetical protein
MSKGLMLGRLCFPALWRWTAPATTLIVLNEYDAEGPMTSGLLALVALIVCCERSVER